MPKNGGMKASRMLRLIFSCLFFEMTRASVSEHASTTSPALEVTVEGVHKDQLLPPVVEYTVM